MCGGNGCVVTGLCAVSQNPAATEPFSPPKSLLCTSSNFFDSPLAQLGAVWYNKSSRGQVTVCLELPAESSRWLLASNCISLQLTPFRGSHSGTKFPEGFPRIAEPPSDL